MDLNSWSAVYQVVFDGTPRKATTTHINFTGGDLLEVLAFVGIGLAILFALQWYLFTKSTQHQDKEKND